jgi:glucokinase
VIMTELTIGVDLGGTKISAVLLDPHNAIRHRVWHKHAARDYLSCLEAIASAVGECRAVARTHNGVISGVGLSLAAWIGPDRRHLLRAANLGSCGEDVRDDLARRLGLPVRVDNDGNLTTVAEWRFGSARGRHDFVLFTLGTGVGGGVVVDGRLVVGNRGLAGELGHIPVQDNHSVCVCGGIGCLETVASGPAVAQAAIRRGLTSSEPGALTAEDVAREAHRGDPCAIDVLTEVGRQVGLAAARLVPVLDPEVIVLAGSLAIGGAPFIAQSATRALADTACLRDLRAAPRLVMAACGPEAAALGAAAMSLGERKLPDSCHRHRSDHERGAPVE